MRIRFILPVLSTLSLAAACGGDDDGGSGGGGPDANVTPDGAPSVDAALPTDARPADVSCADDELPQAAENVTVDGLVFSLDGTDQVPLADVRVRAYPVGDEPTGEPLAEDVTLANGLYEVTAPTGGVPLDAYLHAVKLVDPDAAEPVADTSYFPSRLYPPMPVATSQGDVPIPVLDQDALDLVSLFTGGSDQDHEKGIIVAVVVDCAGQPAAGATVITDPAAGNVIYANEMGIPSVNRQTTSNSGLVFLLNVPDGAVTINAQIGDQQLREHVVESVGGPPPENENDPFAGEITATAVTPFGANLQ